MNTSESIVDTDQETVSDADSEDSDTALSMMVGLGMKQKIEALKARRRTDRVSMILTAVARGDIAAMKRAFRVRPQTVTYLSALIVKCIEWIGRKILG
jgi:hypothetical protein